MTENQLTYGNKAKNLEFVARNTEIEIPYFKQIYLEDLEHIEKILVNFSKKIMIRSNSSEEDEERFSSAGKYLSLGPIDKQNIVALKK